MSMELREFIKESHRAVDSFGMMWIARHREAPENYPMNLNPEDWTEQFLAFEANKSNTV